MGFAGQVFAARVAVGLALPSPKAFSQAGQMVGGFAAKLYGDLNKRSTEAGAAQVKFQEKSLAKARKALETHQKGQGSTLQRAADQSINSLRNAYKGLKASAATSSQAVAGLKQTLGDTAVSRKLFPHAQSDLKEGARYEAMMKNFIGLQQYERAEVINSYHARELAIQSTINLEKAKGEEGKTAVAALTLELQWIQEQRKEFEIYNKARVGADQKYNATHKDLVKNVKDGEKSLQEAQAKSIAMQKANLAVMQHLTKAGNDFAVMMKTNFYEAIRESVSVLTAFYYKLSESTAQLIEFERELLNANSVFRVTNDELFAVGEQVVQFGQKFGIEMQNGAQGLYQLASAGLSAADSALVLSETLKLSMAVQGDHNTISKLVTQTLFGFEMEMSQAAEVTDKFAYAIQKSLIEYEDLASAVKFALPFFTSTGQSIDQLLGALQILTNRALEAGIAGRGLRQGLAELAESIGDSTARFREYGVEVTDAQGNMLKLTEIAANFANVLETGVINDTELLTTLIEDLNVRGATAFVHLVQASDEFTEAVEATANAGGELDEMVRIQNESIQAQIQILRNNVGMMFLYQDAAFTGTGYLNAFHKAVVETVQDLQDLLVVQENGAYVLTEFGKEIQTIAIDGVAILRDMMKDIIPIIRDFVTVGGSLFELLKLYAIPLKIIITAFQIMGPTLTRLVIAFYILNKVIPISTAVGYAYHSMQLRGVTVTNVEMAALAAKTTVSKGETAAMSTKFFWSRLITLWRLKDITGIYAYTAAESYSATLKGLDITLSETQAAQMTRKTFLRLLETNGIVLESAALKGKEAPQIAEMVLSEHNIFVKIRLIFTRYADAVAIWWENFSLGAKIKQTVLDTITMSYNGFVTLTNIIWKNYYTLATWLQTYAEAAKGTTTAWTTSVQVIAGIALFGYAVILIFATVAAWFYAAPAIIIAAATAALFSPFIAVGLAIVVFIALLYIGAQRINEQIDVMFYLKQMIGSIGGMFLWLGKLMIAPFIWAAEAIYNFIEGPMFRLILFLKALSGMFKWLIGAIVDAVLNVGHSSLTDILTAPFNLAKAAIMFVVGVLWTNPDSLKNKLVEFVTWLTTESFLAPVFDAASAAISLAKDGLVILWEYLTTTFTAANISSALGGIGAALGGIFNAPIDAFKTAYNGMAAMLNGVSMTIAIPGFGIGLPDWAGGYSFDWAGYSHTMTLGNWPLFDMGGAGAGAAGAATTLTGATAGGSTSLDAVASQRTKSYTDTDMSGADLMYAQYGATVPSRKAGGPLSMRPYLVGEAGPELFIPNIGGKILPNKDLNTQRVKDMLRDAFGLAPRDGAADKAGGVSVGAMRVGSLIAGNARMKKTRLGVDTFA